MDSNGLLDLYKVIIAFKRIWPLSTLLWGEPMINNKFCIKNDYYIRVRYIIVSELRVIQQNKHCQSPTVPLLLFLTSIL